MDLVARQEIEPGRDGIVPVGDRDRTVLLGEARERVIDTVCPAARRLHSDDHDFVVIPDDRPNLVERTAVDPNVRDFHDKAYAIYRRLYGDLREAFASIGELVRG